MLNEQQLQVVNSNADKIVCIASAGSGKTTVLLQRIKRLISEGVRADSILVLTFTNAAAQELTDRFKRDNKGTIIIPEFRTFHAFCYSLIVKDKYVRNHLGYTDIPKIATEDDTRKAWSITKLVCHITLSDKKLSSKKDTLLPKEQFEHDIFWKAYKKQLCKDNLITFDILCYDVSQLFVDDLNLVAEYKMKYKYLLLDEFQDTDIRQWDFATSFYDSKIFVCGDPQQMLYRFRGCTNEIIKQLAEDPEYELIKLPYNYRSTKQIVDYSNKIFAVKWSDSPYYLAGQTDKEGVPIHICGSFPDNTNDLAEIAIEMQTSVNEGKSVAILCRTNAEVAEVQGMFRSMHIPTRGKADNSEVIGILKSSISSEYCVQWIASLLPNEVYLQYIRLSTLDPSFKEEQKFLQTFATKHVRLLDKIYHCRSMLSENKLPANNIMDVLHYLNVKCDIHIDDLLPMDLQQGIDSVVEIIEEAVTYGIYVGTIHSVKGLEYDIVHVIGVDGKSFNTMKNEDEMACFYVACTRAKEQLYLWYEHEDDGYMDLEDEGSSVDDFYTVKKFY